MARPRMRPSFRIVASCPSESLREALAANLAASEGRVAGTLKSGHCVLEVDAEDRRFWTPSLDLMFDAASEGSDEGTDLWGTFSPRAEIWTALVFVMGTLAIVSFFATMIGLAQWALGHAPIALLVPAGAAILATMIYLAALVGQGLSIAEMYMLRAFLDDCLREAEARAAKTASCPPPASSHDSAAL